jgi:hypothetical protein
MEFVTQIKDILVKKLGLPTELNFENVAKYTIYAMEQIEKLAKDLNGKDKKEIVIIIITQLLESFSPTSADIFIKEVVPHLIDIICSTSKGKFKINFSGKKHCCF